MNNADLRALILGAMKAAYEAGHHATVEGNYHEEWPDDHVDDWMDDITGAGYVRVPVDPTAEIMQVYEDYKELNYNPANAVERYYAKHLHAAMLTAATKEQTNG